MQATVHTFDPDSGEGIVLLDDGRLMPFAPAVFAASGLLYLRLGQRLSIAISATKSSDPDDSHERTVARLWIVGIGHEQIIN